MKRDKFAEARAYAASMGFHFREISEPATLASPSVEWWCNTKTGEAVAMNESRSIYISIDSRRCIEAARAAIKGYLASSDELGLEKPKPLKGKR